MAEVLGAVAASLQLVGLATKAVRLFSDMSTGFKDADKTAALIHEDLFNFKQSAKFAHHNLEHVKIDDLGLRQSLVKYEGTIAQLGHKMQAIQGKKRLWSQTKKWMKLMSSDSEVTMLRNQLKQHTSELTEKFTLVMLERMKQDVKEIKTEVRAHHEFSRSAHQSVMLWQQGSEERLDTIEAKLDAAISLQTPTLSPFRLDDDGLFDLLDLGSPPRSIISSSPPTTPPAAGNSPVRSSSPLSDRSIFCTRNITRRNSDDTLAWCSASSCDANSIHSNYSVHWRSAS
jgi:hypothetical protein